jgi:CHAT domain-containing protein/tetratricopeptide (TPR) repeat protein
MTRPNCPSDVELLMWIDGDPGAPELQGHLDGCPRCREHLARLEAATRALGRFAEAALPSNGDDHDAIDPPNASSRRLAVGALAAALLAAVGAAVLVNSSVHLSATTQKTALAPPSPSGRPDVNTAHALAFPVDPAAKVPAASSISRPADRSRIGAHQALPADRDQMADASNAVTAPSILGPEAAHSLTGAPARIQFLVGLDEALDHHRHDSLNGALTDVGPPPRSARLQAAKDEDIPSRRVLRDDDARQVERLEREMDELERAGQFVEAQVLARKIMEIRTQTQGADHWQTAEANRKVQMLMLIITASPDQRTEFASSYRLLAEASELMRRSRYAEADPLLRKISAINEKVLGVDHPYTSESYNNLALNLKAWGKYDEAEPLYRKALAIRQKVLGEDHPVTATSYNNLALDLEAQGKYAEAESLHRKALAIWEKVLGADHPETATSYNNLAGILDAQGKYTEAESLYRKALAIRQEVLGEDHTQTAGCYNNLALNLDAQGKYDEAESLHRKVLTIWEKALGADHIHTAIGYNSLAFNLKAQGRYTEAEPLLRKALAIRQKVLGADHPQTALGYNNLASNLDAQGKYAEADTLYRKALAIRQNVLGVEHPDTATNYDNLALNLDAQGKYAEAESLHRKALAIRQKVLGADHPQTALVYNNLASNLGAQGKYVEAESLHRKALAIWEKMLGADHFQTATSYNNLAYDLEAQGKYVEAEPLHRKALTIRQEVLGADHPQTANSYNNLAANLEAQGEYAEAESLHRKALAIWEKVLGVDHPDTSACYSNLAHNLQAQGKYPEAEAIWIEAARSFEVARRPVSHTGLERTTFAVERSPLPSLAAVLARRGAAAQAWQQLEADLARGLLDDLARPLRSDERRHEHDLLTRLQRLDEQVAALTAIPGDEEGRRNQVTVFRQQRDALKIEWAEFEASVERSYGAAAGRPYDLSRIQGHIPPDAALVVWLDIRALPHADVPNGEHWACLVRRHGDPTWVKLSGSGQQGRWTDSDDRLPVQVVEAFTGRPNDPAVPWHGLAGQLATQRLAPLAAVLGATGHLPAVRHLIVLPSPALAGVPVEALIEAQPKDSPRYTVSYAPSGTMFAWLQERRQLKLKDQGDRSGPPRLLALGDPTGVQPRLPATRVEVQRIAELFDPANREQLLGAEASEQNLDAMAQDGRLRTFDFILLATHGVMDPQVAMRSRLLLSRDQLPDAVARVLAGQEVYDGELTAEQVLRTWKLDAELVTLSACQSGLGKPGGGEGYLGFSQALFLAGSQSLVLSLWSVDDTATALLMRRFYENLLGKRPGLDRPMPKAAALREAKQWLRRLTFEERDIEDQKLARGTELMPTTTPSKMQTAHPYDHPHYWAGFILIGDPN